MEQPELSYMAGSRIKWWDCSGEQRGGLLLQLNVHLHQASAILLLGFTLEKWKHVCKNICTQVLSGALFKNDSKTLLISQYVPTTEYMWFLTSVVLLNNVLLFRWQKGIMHSVETPCSFVFGFFPGLMWSDPLWWYSPAVTRGTTKVLHGTGLLSRGVQVIKCWIFMCTEHVKQMAVGTDLHTIMKSRNPLWSHSESGAFVHVVMFLTVWSEWRRCVYLFSNDLTNDLFI